MYASAAIQDLRRIFVCGNRLKGFNWPTLNLSISRSRGCFLPPCGRSHHLMVLLHLVIHHVHTGGNDELRFASKGRFRTCVGPGLGQSAELRAQFSLVGRRYCVMGSTVYIEPSFLRQVFLPGAAFPQRPRLMRQKLDRKGSPIYRKAVQVVDSLFHCPGAGAWTCRAGASLARNLPNLPGRRVIAGSGRRVTTALRSVVTQLANSAISEPGVRPPH